MRHEGQAKRSRPRTKQASKPVAAQSKTLRPKKTGDSARAAPTPSRVRASASAKPRGGKAVAKKVSDEAAASKKRKKRASARKKR
jgi:hypothetical protein